MENITKIDLKINLFPRLTRIGRFLGHLLTGPNCLATHGDHFVHKLELLVDDDSLASPLQPYLDLHETDDGIEPWHNDPGARDVVVKNGKHS